MKVCWRVAVIVMFLAGIVLTGLGGTAASMTFLWPAYGFLGLAAVLSIGLVFEKASFALPRWSVLVALALAGYLLARAAHSPVAYFAREDAGLFVAAFLVYGLFLHLLDSAKWRRCFVDVLALLVLLNLGFALVQKLHSPTLWLVPGYERTIASRAGGIFNHPDHFAGFLAMLMPLWLATAAYSRRPPLVRCVMGALGALSAAVVLGTGCATAILTLIAGTGAFAVLSGVILHRQATPQVKRGILLASTGAAVVLALSLAVASGPISRVLDRSLLSKGGDLALPQVWKAGWEQAMESPALGTGSRTSYIYGRLHRSPSLDAAAEEPEFVHNEYLQMLADYGLTGLGLLLLVLALHAAGGFRFVRAYANFGAPAGRRLPSSDHLAHVLGAMSSLGALALLAAFDFVLHLPIFAVVAAAFLAVLAAPDPMAAALKPATSARRLPSILPGGWLRFGQRSLVFGGGLAMSLLCAILSQSEYHYEMARRHFEEDRTGFQHLRHLHSVRALDPKNPFAFTLSAHAQVAGILPEMPGPARRQALEQADAYFARARSLYPQDIFSAIGHAAVLEELERSDEALERLREARRYAPLYGNLMLAEAECHLRHGRILEAEHTFAEAMNAAAFRDTAAAQRGLMTVTEWKLIAGQRTTPAPPPAGPGESRSLPGAKVVERDLAGQAPPPATGTEATDEREPADL